MAAGKRRDGEDFQAYRRRLKNEEAWDKLELKGIRLPSSRTKSTFNGKL